MISNKLSPLVAEAQAYTASFGSKSKDLNQATFNEKFAELIINECAKIADKQMPFGGVAIRRLLISHHE